MNFIKKHYQPISLILLILLASLLRLYNFEQHWNLSNDDSRDALIAREALKRNEYPVMGSFSSAGPFAFGPLFYWVVMGSYKIAPNIFSAPWIATALSSIATVLVLYYCGKTIKGHSLGIVLGILAATSPQLVIRAQTLGQHSFIALTASLYILMFLLYSKYKQVRYVWLMGISIGIALSMHYQAINLLFCAPALLLVTQISLKKKIYSLIVFGIGILIPSIPYLLWELRQEFANTRNILDYLLIGQYRIYVPNSWKLFLGQFLPNYWSFVLGGYPLIATSILATLTISFPYLLIKKVLASDIKIITAFFMLLLIINRYYKGERSEGYLLYFIPFIIIVCGYTLHTLMTLELETKYRKIINKSAALLIFTVVIGNISYYQKNYLNYTGNYRELKKETEELIKKYPNTKFAVYDYKWQHSYQSQPLSFLLETYGKSDMNGMPIGFTCTKECPGEYQSIHTIRGVPVYDLQTVPEIQKDSRWMNVSQKGLYDDLMKWSKTEKLKSTFRF